MAYEAGKYKAEVLKAYLKTAGSGTDQVAVEFALTSGPNAGESITEYLALTDKAIKYTVEKLETCGWGGDLDNLASMTGTKVQVTLRHEEYEGKTRARVSFIDPIGGSGVVGDPVESAAIAARWKDRLAAFTKPATKDPF